MYFKHYGTWCTKILKRYKVGELRSEQMVEQRNMSKKKLVWLRN